MSVHQRMSFKNYTVILSVFANFLFSCTNDDDFVKPQNEVDSKCVAFSVNEKQIKISSRAGKSFSSAHAINERGDELADLETKGFGSIFDSTGDGRYRFEIIVSKWISEEEIDYVNSNFFMAVVKPEPFKGLFVDGGKSYAKNAYPITSTNEVLIEFFDENAVMWSTSYRGSYDSTPSYKDLQPSSDFTIIRSIPFGNDSIFVEIKFEARLYKDEIEFMDIEDGRFNGFFYRTL